MITTLGEIVDAAKGRGRRRMAFCEGGEGAARRAARRAREEGLIDLLLVRERERALELLRSGEADLVLEGQPLDGGLLRSLHEKGLISRRSLSYASLFEGEGKLVIFTDTYVNSYPDVGKKAGIIENAVELSHLLGVQEPKVAVLSAIELVNPSMRSTLDAAALSKMAERGQFGKVLVEGPLAMDNATSAEAARIKGIANPVSGDADIYLVPDGETGFLLTELLYLYGRRRMAGALLGTEVPLVPVLEWDDPESLFFSIALAVLRSR